MSSGLRTLNIERLWQETCTETLAATSRVGASASFILGPEVAAFEKNLSEVWPVPHVIGVASGLDALEISLRILGCGPGDRVLTTPLSAFATTLAILKLGAIPVFADTTPDGLIDLARCRTLLATRPDIRYFVPVHLYGQPLNPAELRRLRDDFDLRMVEDCAQSISSTWFGQPTGLGGQMAATSFYPTKNLGAMGDGGAVLTSDPALADHARALRDYGQTGKYLHSQIGYNSRLDELQAAIMNTARLPHLPAWNQTRLKVASQYLENLNHPLVRMLALPPHATSNWHLFPVFVAPAQRESLASHLRSKGIETAIHYPVAIPDQPALNSIPFELADPCACARLLCESELSLPLHPFLTAEDAARVIHAINSWPETSV